MMDRFLHVKKILRRQMFNKDTLNITLCACVSEHELVCWNVEMYCELEHYCTFLFTRHTQETC